MTHVIGRPGQFSGVGAPDQKPQGTGCNPAKLPFYSVKMCLHPLDSVARSELNLHCQPVLLMTITSRQLIDTRLTVETPEGVDFQFRLAGAGLRKQAWIADQFVKILILGLFFATLVLITYSLSLELSFPEFSGGMMLVAWFLLDWFYGAIAEGMLDGQTPGKKHYKLRVVRTNGTPVDLLAAIGRNFLRTADFLPVGFATGLLCMVCTRRMQRLGDLFFDTMVIEERSLKVIRPEKLLDGVPPLDRSECRRRFHVPDRTLSIIERLYDPLRPISDARREEIAAPLSEALQNYMGYEDAGPNHENPYLYFQEKGRGANWFLLRVLKTFSLTDKDAQTAPRAAARAVPPELPSSHRRRQPQDTPGGAA